MVPKSGFVRIQAQEPWHERYRVRNLASKATSKIAQELSSSNPGLRIFWASVSHSPQSRPIITLFPVMLRLRTFSAFIWNATLSLHPWPSNSASISDPGEDISLDKRNVFSCGGEIKALNPDNLRGFLGLPILPRVGGSP